MKNTLYVSHQTKKKQHGLHKNCTRTIISVLKTQKQDCSFMFVDYAGEQKTIIKKCSHFYVHIMSHLPICIEGWMNPIQ